MKKPYLKIFCAILLFSFISLNIKDLHAGVYFISKSDTVNSQKQSTPCVAAGYKKVEADCTKLGQALANLCPTDAKYGKSCSCDTSKFKYDTSNCSGSKSPSGEICGGKYDKCDCNTNTYKYYSNADCPTNKTVDTSSSCTYTDKKVGYSKCSCPSQYSETCSSNQDGVGAACDGKYTSCKCKSNFIDCGGQKAASGATACTDSTGTKYTSCQPVTCENGGYVSAIPANNNCTTVSYNGLTCYKDCKAKTCTDGGYVASIPSGQSCTTQDYAGLTCYKDCKAACAATVSCSYGCKTTCNGKCVECYPACTGTYMYNFTIDDCYVRPYIIRTQPSNPNCGKCDCDNSNSNCGGRACACMYI